MTKEEEFRKYVLEHPEFCEGSIWLAWKKEKAKQEGLNKFIPK